MQYGSLSPVLHKLSGRGVGAARLWRDDRSGAQFTFFERVISCVHHFLGLFVRFLLKLERGKSAGLRQLSLQHAYGVEMWKDAGGVAHHPNE
jgi:hypothetical protein